jgi:DNA-binding MarR family transcriptional regulator
MSIGPMSREALIEALNTAFRSLSAQSVLHSQAIAGRLGIGSTDLECLDFVAMCGPLTAGELAQASGLTTGAITGVIDRLERAGFARRERDAADRRKVLVYLQPEVATRIGPMFEPMQRHVNAALDAYGDEELARLLDILGRVAVAGDAAMAEVRAGNPPSAHPREGGDPGFL